MPRRALALAAGIGLLLGAALPAAARNVNATNTYGVHILQSDTAASPDTDLVNGWGIVASPTSPWWVSDNGTHKSTLYNGNTGAKLGLSRDGSRRTDRGRLQRLGERLQGRRRDRPACRRDSSSRPTTARSPAGTASGPRRSARSPTPDDDLPRPRDRQQRRRELPLRRQLQRAARSTSSTARSTTVATCRATSPIRALPDGYAPFDIQAIGGELFVAYAKQDADGDEEVAGEGLGYRRRLRYRRQLPWPRRHRRRAERPVGPGHGAGELRQVQRRPAGRQLRRRPDPRVPRRRRRLGGARRREGHRPPADRDRRPVGHRLRQRRHRRARRTRCSSRPGPDDETHGLFGSITAP